MTDMAIYYKRCSLHHLVLVLLSTLIFQAPSFKVIIGRICTTIPSRKTFILCDCIWAMLQIRTQIALSGVVQTWVRQSRTLIIGRPCQKASSARKGHDVYWETLSRGGVTPRARHVHSSFPQSLPLEATNMVNFQMRRKFGSWRMVN